MARINAVKVYLTTDEKSEGARRARELALSFSDYIRTLIIKDIVSANPTRDNLQFQRLVDTINAPESGIARLTPFHVTPAGPSVPVGEKDILDILDEN
jgi:hypothetical protein